MNNNISNKPYKLFYNREDDVIDLDISNLSLTKPLAVAIFDDLVQMAKSQPHKVYIMTCWQGAVMPPDVKDYYAFRMTELLPLIKGVARYQVTEFLTKMGVKVSNISINNSTTMFATRAEALEAVRSGKV